MVLTMGMSPLESVLKLIGVLLLFIIILAATYFTTRLIGNIQNNQRKKSNFKIIEGFKVAPGKYLQLIQIGSKYYLIGIGKNEISIIKEIKQEDLLLGEELEVSQLDFSKHLNRLMDKVKKKEDKG